MLRILPAAASVVAICVGALALVGWFFDIELLKRISPHFVAVNPASATLFILAGIALALSIRKERSGLACGFAKVLSGIVLLAALAKIIGLVMHWHPNIDEILFAGKLSAPQDKLPNRMAPNTALTFFLIGAALLTLDRPVKRFSPSQMFAVLAGFGALLPLIGYVFEVESFRGLAAFIPMALHTAITFLILASGLYFARPETPLAQVFASHDSCGVLARRLLPAAIGLTLLLGWLRLQGELLGYYDGRFGLALYAFGNCVLFGLLIRWTVATLSKVETDRAATHRALSESSSALQDTLRQVKLVIDHAREIICTLDEEGRFISVNAASAEVLGVPESDLLHKSFCDQHAPEDRHKIETVFRDLKAGLIAKNFEARCRRRDHSFAEITWSIQSSPHYRKTFCVGRAQDNGKRMGQDLFLA